MREKIEYEYKIPINRIIKEGDNYSVFTKCDSYKLLIIDEYTFDLNLVFSINKYLLSRDLINYSLVLTETNNLFFSHNGKKYLLCKMINDFLFASVFELKIETIFESLPRLWLPYEISDNSNNYVFRWKILWQNKIDYFEKQMIHLKGKFPILNTVSSYYIGMAENAILYLTLLIEKQSDFDSSLLAVSHNLWNYRKKGNFFLFPTNLTIDLRIRDISEIIKFFIFFKSNTPYQLFSHIKKLGLSLLEINLLIARLLFPTYFFAICEDIFSLCISEEEVSFLLKKSEEYQEKVISIIEFLSKEYTLFKITWLDKN